MDRKDYYPFIEQPDKLLRTIANSTGTHLDKLIGQYVSSERIEYFGISAIGVDEETQESLVDEGTNTIRNPEKIRPINILEPLGWLFHELFFV